MTIKLTKAAIDLGIVTTDPQRLLAFYRDTLGFKMAGEMPMPDDGQMYLLQCGSSTIKIVVNGKKPKACSPPGGIAAATGYRYWTISLSNIDEVVAQCTEAGYKVIVPRLEVQPGIIIAMVEDPDGNWVEFMQAA